MLPWAALLLLLLMTPSCNKDTSDSEDNTLPDNNSKNIRISGQDVNTITKTTLSGFVTSWVATTDKVGVYCEQATGGNTNVEYIASTSAATSLFTGAMKWGAGLHTFYAYYPYSAGSPALNVVPVSLSATQTQNGTNSTHIGALDFMVASPMTGVTPGTAGESTTVNLSYNHVFSLLEFKIKRSGGSGNITKIKLTAPTENLSLTSGTLDLREPTPGAGISYTIASPVGGKEITLTITGGVTPTDDYATTPSIFMMIAPGDHSSDSLTIGVEYDSNPGVYSYFNKIGTSFTRGVKYIVPLEQSVYSGTTLLPVMIGTVTWAPVNAGYDGTHLYGLNYQWCRKYGQGYYNATLSPLETNPTLTAGTVTLAVGNDVANTDVFYTTTNVAPYDWCSPQASVWDNASSPCPTGWRLPTSAELTALLASNSTWTAAGPGGLAGRWFGNDNGAATPARSIFMPAAGARNLDGVENSRATWGYYWSGERNGARAYNIVFTSTGTPAIFDNGKRGFGFSVRCVKE
jgi:uncharacterized protein (TIGR02145 family)